MCRSCVWRHSCITAARHCNTVTEGEQLQYASWGIPYSPLGTRTARAAETCLRCGAGADPAFALAAAVEGGTEARPLRAGLSLEAALAALGPLVAVEVVRARGGATARPGGALAAPCTCKGCRLVAAVRGESESWAPPPSAGLFWGSPATASAAAASRCARGGPWRRSARRSRPPARRNRRG